MSRVRTPMRIGAGPRPVMGHYKRIFKQNDLLLPSLPFARLRAKKVHRLQLHSELKMMILLTKMFNGTQIRFDLTTAQQETSGTRYIISNQ